MTPDLPEQFLAEVAAARQEYSRLAPAVLALADRYRVIEREFTDLTRGDNLADDAYFEAWSDCGAAGLQTALESLALALAKAAGLRIE